MTIYLSLAIAILGTLVFAVTDHPKLSELGRAMLWTGLLAFLLTAGRTVI